MTFLIKLSTEFKCVNLIQGNWQREEIFGLKSSPMLSEHPFTHIPLLDKDFHVFNPLVQTILVEDNRASSGNADFLAIQIQ